MRHDTYNIVTRSGRAYALWSDGRLLPIVSGGDGDDDPPKPDPTKGGGDGGGDDDPPKPKGDEGTDGKLSMTQAELDALIDKRLGRAKAKWEADVKAAGDLEQMNEAERLKAEKAAAEAAAAEAVSSAHQSVLRSEAKAAALAAGVDKAKVGRFMRLVTFDEDMVDADGTVDEAALDKAVAAVLAEFPEFGATASGKGGTSGGDFGGSGTGKTWTREEVAKLSDAEFTKHEAEIMEQMAAGALK